MLKYLISEKLPRLYAHLLQHKVDLSLFTFNWFLTVFVDNVPVQLYLRIWDAFLYEGSKVSDQGSQGSRSVTFDVWFARFMPGEVKYPTQGINL